jgi:hypothetical protein
LNIGVWLQIEAVEVEYRKAREPGTHLTDQRGVADHRMKRQAGRSMHAQPDAVIAGRDRRLDVLDRRCILQRRRCDDDLVQALPR